MSTTVAGTPCEVTPDELLTMPDGDRYELVDGRLVEQNSSLLSSLVEAEIIRRLVNHVDEHNLGWVFSATNQYRCFPWKPSMIRRPDASFIRRERITAAQISSDGFTTIVPDLVVEIVSRNDVVSELTEKIWEYRRAGVPLIWVIDPETRVGTAHRLDRTAIDVGENDELDGEDVLPGFRVVLGSLLPPASPESGEVGGREAP